MMLWGVDERGLTYCPEHREEGFEDKRLSPYIRYTCIVCGLVANPDGVELDSAFLGTMEVTYGEARAWIVWLRVFTASTLAESMGVDWVVADRFTRAAEWHGIVKDTGDRMNGGLVPGDETIWSYVPLPSGPRFHPRITPEWRVWPCYELAPHRGMPVRIVTENRKAASTPGSRLQIKLRQKRYETMMEARAKSKEAAKKKAEKEAKKRQRKVGRATK